MRLIKRTAARVTVGVLSAAAVAVSGPVAAQSAMADTAPVTGTLTITPSTTVVGGEVTVVATLTNNTSSVAAASLGIQDPQYIDQQFTGLSGTGGCHPRHLHVLMYCGNNLLAPGASMTITLTLTAIATGTDNFSSYARLTNLGGVTSTGTLTIS